MKKPSSLPAPLRTSAIRVSEALTLGASEKRLRRVDIRRPLHGVVTTLPPQNLLDLCRAYLPVRPPGAFFSGPTAAALHGIPLPSRLPALDVSVPAPARAPRRRGVRGHSTRVRLGDVMVRAGLPVSAPERTWCELSRDLGVEDLVVAGDWLMRDRGGTSTTAALAQAVRGWPTSRGRPKLDRALALLDPRAESPQESRLRVRLRLGGVMQGTPNSPIVTSSGRAYRGDIVFDRHRVILEYQGDHHRRQKQYRQDLTRRLDLQGDGWTIVELGPADIADPGLVRRVRAILAVAATRATGASARAASARAASAPAPRR
jgi:hypothetical protein